MTDSSVDPLLSASRSHENTLDEVYSVLTDPHCRYVLDYFHDTPDEVATLTAIAHDLSRRAETNEDEERIAVTLHHVALPKLADAGLVEYDHRSSTVRYRGLADLQLPSDHGSAR